MNYLEQTYLQQINQLQKELNTLKLNNRLLFENENELVYETPEDFIKDNQQDPGGIISNTVDSIKNDIFTAAGLQALMNSPPINYRDIERSGIKGVLQYNVQSFFTNLMPIADVGDKLAATLINAAGRNPLEFAKAVGYTRYNPFGVYSDYETRQQQQAQLRAQPETE